MADWIGETFTSDVGWDHLERLVDIGNRMAGSEGEREAAEATRDALAAVGARDAHLDEFDIQGWVRGSSSVEAAAGSEECIALPRSPAGEVSGELVDVGHGLPGDFDRDLEGAVVMAASNVPGWYDRFLHRREKYYRAVEGGAAAFVFRNHVEGCLAPTGSVGTPGAPIGDIPAVGVSKEVGARLARRDAGEPVTVRVDCETPPATSQNVHADLGPDTDEAVLLTSHVDAHDIAEGAGDNGAGTAMVVELARTLAAREAELDTRVHVVCFGAEEVGLLGSGYDAEERAHDDVVAVVNNDGVGVARTLKAYTHGFDGLRDAVGVVADRFDHPIATTPRLGPHSDHWQYVKWGVPGYHLTSETGSADRGWGHTRADTLDKLEPRTLREQAVLITELVVHLADEGTTVAHREPEAIAAQLDAEDYAEGLQVTGDWPY
ncbi:M28 family metallopeptidase [Haloglomus litoreum]|uniref:M28 family metallopeptidase n=1 Tax=Haloglomus litoreum TaxID=3034026 RepID=UPI0023E804B4|nr:M28 family metallopeptidase [Haloglomus sp. DT116]